MFLQLAHTRLDVFTFSQELALECYKITKLFPDHEKFAMVQQIRRAAMSVHLNIAEGCSRKSIVERRRFFEIARGSAIEVDAALDVAVELNYTDREKLSELGEFLKRSFQMISKMISK